MPLNPLAAKAIAKASDDPYESLSQAKEIGGQKTFDYEKPIMGLLQRLGWWPKGETPLDSLGSGSITNMNDIPGVMRGKLKLTNIFGKGMSNIPVVAGKLQDLPIDIKGEGSGLYTKAGDAVYAPQSHIHQQLIDWWNRIMKPRGYEPLSRETAGQWRNNPSGTTHLFPLDIPYDYSTPRFSSAETAAQKQMDERLLDMASALEKKGMLGKNPIGVERPARNLVLDQWYQEHPQAK